MARRLDGIKPIKKKQTAPPSSGQEEAVLASKKTAAQSKKLVRKTDGLGQPAELQWPAMPLSGSGEALRDWRQRKKDERRRQALIKKEKKSTREQLHLESTEQDRKGRLEGQWSKAREAKVHETRKRRAKEKRRRAKEKMRAERLAQRLHTQKAQTVSQVTAREPQFRTSPLGSLRKHGGRARVLVVRVARATGQVAGVVGAVVVGYVLFAAVLLQGPSDAFLIRAGRAAVPLPALLVNGRPVSYERLQTEQQLDSAYVHLSEVLVAEQGNWEWAAASAADRLANKVLLERWAARYDIEMQPQAITDHWQRYANAYGGEEALTDAIYNQQGVTPTIVKEEIVYYDALYEAVAQGYRADDHAHRATLARLQAIRERWENGSGTFANLAMTYSEDDYALTGGDRGYVAFADMDDELAAAVRSLRPGEVSGILHGDGYYYIVQLQEEISPDREEAWLRQIALAINDNFHDPWQDRKKAASVFVLVRE